MNLYISNIIQCYMLASAVLLADRGLDCESEAARLNADHYQGEFRAFCL